MKVSNISSALYYTGKLFLSSGSEIRCIYVLHF